MKKIIAISLAVVMVLIMCCGCNIEIGEGNSKFAHLSLDTYHDNACYTVDKWYYDKGGIEVETEEAGSIFCSEGTYILFENGDHCPFCNKEG